MSHASSLVGGEAHSGNESLYRGRVGLMCFFLSEAHMFGALVVAYLFYLEQSRHSSTPPGDVLHLPLSVGMTVCLLGSSGTIFRASAALRGGTQTRFRLWWLATIVLGILFLVGTGFEWYDLIVNHGLTLSRNFFGTTYFSLIGLHAAHVTIGVAAMLIVLGLALAAKVPAEPPVGAELVSWYWHFVDGVWVVIFIVVYLVSR